MKFEHFAINVPDAAAHAQWYVAQLGFTIVRQLTVAPFTHFLADESGRVIVELYSNTTVKMPDYANLPPLNFHLAVVAADAKAERARLEQAGATLFLEDTQPDGSLLVMLRDPWQVPLQLCQRVKLMPMPQ